jgi:hypothetical protein
LKVLLEKKIVGSPKEEIARLGGDGTSIGGRNQCDTHATLHHQLAVDLPAGNQKQSTAKQQRQQNLAHR